MSGHVGMNSRVGEINAVVFDLGGVLIDWSPQHLYRKLIADDAERERFLTEVCPQSWNRRGDAGEPFATLIRERIAAFPEHAGLIEAWWQRYDEMCPESIEPTVEILAELRDAGVALVALTNWSAETFPRIERRFPFLGWFDGIVISGHEGIIKPDPEIFERLCTRHGIVPEEAVFTDDDPENVMAAAELGFTGVVFTGADDLRATLVSLGVLEPKG